MGFEIIRTAVVVRRRIPGVGLHFRFIRMSFSDRQLLRRLMMLTPTPPVPE